MDVLGGDGVSGTGPVHTRAGAKLPHWTREGGIYFVTFRLADSLPAGAMEGLRIEHVRSRRDGQAAYCPPRDYVQKPLDEGMGECHLREPGIAAVVQGALLHSDGQRYYLLSWCIMPNHVHAIVRPSPPHTLSQILHSWKSFTAKQANAVLGKTGPFWQPEYYDHLVRDARDLDRCLEYVARNPEEAGLTNWPWSGAKIRYACDFDAAGNP